MKPDDREILAALDTILDKTIGFQDEGPEGEGWQSSELSGALYTLQELADALRAETQKSAPGR